MSDVLENDNPDAMPLEELLVEDEEKLLGAMRDRVLEVVYREVKRTTLPEEKQININLGVEHACKVALRRAFKVAAGRSFPAIEMQLVDVKKTAKRVIEAKVSAPYNVDDWHEIGEAEVCMVVVGCSAAEYEGAMPAQVDKDQPELLETPEEKAKREAIEREQQEHEASVERARQFRESDPPPPRSSAATVDNDTGDIIDEDAPKLPRGHRGGRRAALPAPPEA